MTEHGGHAARGSAGLRRAGHGRDRRGGPAAAARPATCLPSSSASSTSSSWPIRRWRGGAATWARRCGWSTPPPSSIPVVPVESERAAGAVVKKGMRSLLLWYVGWVTHQMSQSASAVSRALHIVDDRLGELERQVEGQRVPAAGVVEFPSTATRRRLVGRAGHRGAGQGARAGSCTPPAATGGWCGGSSRPAATPTASIRVPAWSTAATLGTLDLRGEPVAEHLRAVAAAGLGAIVLSGIVDGMAGARARPAAQPPSGPGWRRAGHWSCTR